MCTKKIKRKKSLKILIFSFLFLLFLSSIINALAYVKDIATISSEEDANLTDNAATTTIPIIGDFRIRLFDIATISSEEDANSSDNVVSAAVDVVTATGFAREYILKNIATLFVLDFDSNITDNADQISLAGCLTECVWGQNPFPDCTCLAEPEEEACEIVFMTIIDEGIWCAGESRDVNITVKEEGISQEDIEVTINVLVEEEEFEFTGTTNAEGVTVISVIIENAGSYTLNAVAAEDCGSRQLDVEVVYCAPLTCSEQGGEDCPLPKICSQSFISASDTLTCCPPGATCTLPPEKILSVIGIAHDCNTLKGEATIMNSSSGTHVDAGISVSIINGGITQEEITDMDGKVEFEIHIGPQTYIIHPYADGYESVDGTLEINCPPIHIVISNSLSCDVDGCKLISDVETTKLIDLEIDLSEFSEIITGTPSIVQKDGSSVEVFTVSAGVVSIPSVSQKFTITYDTEITAGAPNFEEGKVTILIRNPTTTVVEIPKLSIPMPDIGNSIIERVLYTPMGGTQQTIEEGEYEANERLIINKEITINPTITSNELVIEFRPPCVCSGWENVSCGAPCPSTRMYKTRTCPLVAGEPCDVISQCIPTDECGCKPRGEDCSLNEDCCTGLCDGICVACTSDAQCAENEKCFNGVCVAKETPTHETGTSSSISEAAEIVRIETRDASPILEIFGIARQKAVVVCTLGTSCDTSADCHDSECINGKCVCCIKTCTSSRECCTGYCDNGYCKEPPSMALFAATTRISGCTGLIEECLPGERGCIYLCNGISILLAILALGVGFSFWKFYKNPIVSIIAMVIPAAIGFVTYPFIGIILALAMIGLMLTRR